MNAIIRLELRKSIQDTGLWFFTIILPILFTVLFIAILTNDTGKADKASIITSIVPGYTVMFVFFIIITMVDTFMKDLNVGMTARLASTPISTGSYLIGKWIPYLIIVLIQMAVLFLFGKIVYDIPLQQPLFLLLIAFSLTFTVTGFGLAIALSVKTFNMGLVITQLLALGGAVLSGLWMPIEFMPNIFQMISRLFPQYWAHESLQQAMEGTLNVSNSLPTIGLLIGYGMIGFIVAFSQYPRYLKRAYS